MLTAVRDGAAASAAVARVPLIVARAHTKSTSIGNRIIVRTSAADSNVRRRREWYDTYGDGPAALHILFEVRARRGEVLPPLRARGRRPAPRVRAPPLFAHPPRRAAVPDGRGARPRLHRGRHLFRHAAPRLPRHRHCHLAAPAVAAGAVLLIAIANTKKWN